MNIWVWLVLAISGGINYVAFIEGWEPRSEFGQFLWAGVALSALGILGLIALLLLFSGNFFDGSTGGNEYGCVNARYC